MAEWGAARGQFLIGARGGEREVRERERERKKKNFTPARTFVPCTHSILLHSRTLLLPKISLSLPFRLAICSRFYHWPNVANAEWVANVAPRDAGQTMREIHMPFFRETPRVLLALRRSTYQRKTGHHKSPKQNNSARPDPLLGGHSPDLPSPSLPPHRDLYFVLYRPIAYPAVMSSVRAFSSLRINALSSMTPS